jgi:hypothetical protein
MACPHPRFVGPHEFLNDACHTPDRSQAGERARGRRTSNVQAGGSPHPHYLPRSQPPAFLRPAPPCGPGLLVFAAGPLSYGGVVSSRLYLAITVLVGVVVVLSTVYGVWQFETYVYPPGCTLEHIHACGAWLWDYSAPLRTHPH